MKEYTIQITEDQIWVMANLLDIEGHRLFKSDAKDSDAALAIVDDLQLRLDDREAVL